MIQMLPTLLISAFGAAVLLAMAISLFNDAQRARDLAEVQRERLGRPEGSCGVAPAGGPACRVL